MDRTVRESDVLIDGNLQWVRVWFSDSNERERRRDEGMGVGREEG
jgi:hypothetical protein